MAAEKSRGSRGVQDFKGIGPMVRRRWRQITSWLSDDYEPARHYMRGGGPKSRQRQEQASQEG